MVPGGKNHKSKKWMGDGGLKSGKSKGEVRGKLACAEILKLVKLNVDVSSSDRQGSLLSITEERGSH